MSVFDEEHEERLAHTIEDAKQIGIRAMEQAQMLAAGNETEFQYIMTLVMQQMLLHLGMSLAATKIKEELGFPR